MEGNEDRKFMRRCLDLASKAEGLTFPNPLVGSVVVHKGKIIGEGYHLRAGLPHAEVNAVNSVINKPVLKDSTIYVSLEPCSHFGKTPPCADFIIENSIPRVVIGAVDTSRKVSGRGIERLLSAGCEVVSVMEDESRWMNRRFFTFHEKQRPWIILKWAQSADGFIDIVRTGNDPGTNWITGKAERVLVHRWRSCEQSILVGARTMRADDPALNVREWIGSDPLRLVLSSSGDIRPFRIPGSSVVFTRNKSASVPGSEIVTLGNNKPSCIQIADFLYGKGIQSLLIEGGSQIINHFMKYSLWDEARIFTGHDHFKQGIKAPFLNGRTINKIAFSGSTLEVIVRDT